MDSESAGTLDLNHKLPAIVADCSSFARIHLRMAQHATSWLYRHLK